MCTEILDLRTSLERVIERPERTIANQFTLENINAVFSEVLIEPLGTIVR